MSGLRIVSLLPSATEIVAAMGMADYLVGRSHQCDFPARVQALPVLSATKVRLDGTSADIDRRVSEIIAQGVSVYSVDAERLRALKPDVIVTQTQCAVCAVTPADLEEALCE
ncbi:ABC transporter substrate-binding protein [Phenylobacterium sp.]